MKKAFTFAYLLLLSGKLIYPAAEAFPNLYYNLLLWNFNIDWRQAEMPSIKDWAITDLVLEIAFIGLTGTYPVRHAIKSLLTLDR